MKYLRYLLLVVALSHQSTNAQFYKSVLPDPAFTNALEKIVVDFRVNFKTIQGDLLSQEAEVDTYESTVKLPGATACVIQHYHSIVDTTASWQGVMYSGDDYGEAVKTYNNTCRLLKKAQVHWIDRSLVGFTGKIEPATADVRFAMSSFDFDLQDARYQHFKAQVEMVSSYNGFEVHVNLLTQKPDAEGTASVSDDQ